MALTENLSDLSLNPQPEGLGRSTDKCEELIKEDFRDEMSFKQFWTSGFGFHCNNEQLPVPPPMSEEIAGNIAESMKFILD